MDTTIKDFEAAVAELEGIVKKLEEAERRIEILDERGELRPAPATLSGGRPEDDRRADKERTR